MGSKKAKPKAATRDSIVDLVRVRAGDLLANAKNWRTHPPAQQEALRAVLSEIGYVDALVARRLNGKQKGKLELIDGHLRAGLDPDEIVPVLVVDLDDAETAKALATFDPLGAMATADTGKLDALLREVQTGSEALAAMLTGLAERAGMFHADGIDAPQLADGDREPFQQMTFTLHDLQAEIVKRAVEEAKQKEDFSAQQNENSNGNALAAIAEAYLGTG